MRRRADRIQPILATLPLLAAAALLAACSARQELATAGGDPCAFPLPPPSQVPEAEFEQALFTFLDNKCYDQLDWAQDKCPMRWTVHGMVRIHYSPQVVEWLENDRLGPVPDGSLIVKAQYTQEDSGGYELGWWTTMTMDHAGSKDGWFWSYHPVPDNDSLEVRNAETLEATYPESMFGKTDCLNCHASAVVESTYVELANIEECEAETTPLVKLKPARPAAPPQDPHSRVRRAVQALEAAPQPKVKENQPDPGFLQVYGFPVAPELDQVKALPGEGLDHVVAGPDGPEEFLTSDQCIGCHDATFNTYNLVDKPADAPPVPPGINMLLPDSTTEPAINYSPYAEAHSSVMGLSGRDPVFFAQLETESTVHAPAKANIQNTCLSCHGVMGQRQLEIDRGEMMSLAMVYAIDGEYAKYGALARDGVSCTVCHHIVIDEQVPFEETFTGKFHVGPADEIYGPYADDVLTQPMENSLGALAQESPRLESGQLMIRSAKLCGSCHTVFVDVLDDEGKPIKKTFEQATYLEWLNSAYQDETPPLAPEAKTCQGCHMKTHRPAGEELSFKIANIEDDTYLPVFPLSTQLPDLDLQSRTPFSRHSFLGINLFTMEMYKQFTYGTAANQLLGIRAADPMTAGNAQAPLDGSLSTALAQAQSEAATIAVTQATSDGATLRALVEVTNLTGHHFPSGVGFRRAFVEFQVQDAGGDALWTSGKTDQYGQIVGPDGQPLPTEYFEEIDGEQVYQHHRYSNRPWGGAGGDPITLQTEVQIYEELTKSPPPESRFTTSFLSLYEHVKDNRLQPLGWKAGGPWAEVTGPDGGAADDCAYVVSDACANHGGPSTGSQVVAYEIPLAALAGAPAKVQATLYYQSIPPYYLAQRFKLLEGCKERNPADPWADCDKPETLRLLFMTSALDTEAEVDGERPISGWKIQVGTPAVRPLS